MHELDGSEIAIIGMAGRFPGAPDLDTFWSNLRDGVESIAFPSEQDLAAQGVDSASLADRSYVKAAAVLDGMDQFDAAFFGMSHREAEITDPQHRIFLECAWTALERAGYTSDDYDGAVGVFGGAATNTYLLFNLISNAALLRTLDPVQIDIANAGDHLTTRTSYKLNLKGPSHLVQSACSTSLVAVHVASQSLLNEECDIALAGGVTINVTHPEGYRYVEGGIVSPDGHCRTFDAQAQGTIFSSGAGVVALKRLADAIDDGDTIHAVIRASAINNDGSNKVGYSAPSVEGQAAVIAEALAAGGIDADTIDYIEAHGTATPMGDPIEIQALSKAFRADTDERQFCAIGSLKTNVGHLGAAAGVAGLIKTTLALQNRQIPPSLHYDRPNPAIDFAASPFYVNSRLREWRAGDHPRRAGVSSFGVGGTNAHVIVEEAPALDPSSAGKPWQILTLSAKTATALDAMTANLAAHLRAHPEQSLADAAYTLQVGRRAFEHRRALVVADRDDAIRALEGQHPQRLLSAAPTANDRPVMFLFTGQGAQYADMGRGLYETEPVFRAAIDRCADLLAPHMSLGLRELLYPQPADDEQAGAGDKNWLARLLADARSIDRTEYAQPALFAVEYALAQLWMSWGVRPAAMMGHSLGEYVAATLAGVFTLEDALRLVAARGKLMQGLPAGSMLAVGLPERDLRAMLGDDLALAAVNGPAQCVVSGPHRAIEALSERLRAQGVECRRLHASHAFHSAMMDPIVDQFAALVGQITLGAPKLRFASNVSGTWISDAEATDPRYWAQHLRTTVRFADGLGALIEAGDAIFLEIGPGATLTRLARQHPRWTRERAALSSLRHPREQHDDAAFLLQTAGSIWLAGGAINWRALHQGERRMRIPLPTYPFERQRYWIDSARAVAAAALPSDRPVEAAPAQAQPDVQPDPQPQLHARPNLLTPYVAPASDLERSIAAIVRQSLGVEQVGVYDNFFELGGDSLLAVNLTARLKRELGVELPVVSLYEGLTIRSLAESIQGEEGELALVGQGAAQFEELEQKADRRKQFQQMQRSRKRGGFND